MLSDQIAHQALSETVLLRRIRIGNGDFRGGDKHR